MNTAILLIIFIPLIEIYLFIKIGTQIGAFNTISLILITAVIGIFYARYEGLNTIRSGMYELYKNKLPFFQLLSGAALALASLLLILPGFATDIIGFALIFPPTRRLVFKVFSAKYNKNISKDDLIEGEYEDKDEKK
tara:strand:- start:5032 stop:5442 length:411 start_codon:yes stop_codon:yes gene_type:complete